MTDTPRTAPLSAEQIAAIRARLDAHVAGYALADPRYYSPPSMESISLALAALAARCDAFERDYTAVGERNKELHDRYVAMLAERDAAVRIAEQRAGEIAALEADVRAVLEDEAFVITRGAMSAQQWSDFKEWTFAALAAAASPPDATKGPPA